MEIKKNLFNIPNILSILRLALVPLIVALFFQGEPNSNNLWVLLLLVLSGFTDFLDGYIARKYNQTTELGKILDPLADKITQVAAFVSMYIVGILPLWLVIFFVLKELLMFIGGLVLLKKFGKVIKSNLIGKAATFAFYIMLGLILIASGRMSDIVALILMLIPTMITAVAFFFYTKDFINSVRTREIESD